MPCRARPCLGARAARSRSAPCCRRHRGQGARSAVIRGHLQAEGLTLGCRRWWPCWAGASKGARPAAAARVGRRWSLAAARCCVGSWRSTAGLVAGERTAPRRDPGWLLGNLVQRSPARAFWQTLRCWSAAAARLAGLPRDARALPSRHRRGGGRRRRGGAAACERPPFRSTTWHAAEARHRAGACAPATRPVCLTDVAPNATAAPGRRRRPEDAAPGPRRSTASRAGGPAAGGALASASPTKTAFPWEWGFVPVRDAPPGLLHRSIGAPPRSFLTRAGACCVPCGLPAADVQETRPMRSRARLPCLPPSCSPRRAGAAGAGGRADDPAPPMLRDFEPLANTSCTSARPAAGG